MLIMQELLIGNSVSPPLPVGQAFYLNNGGLGNTFVVPPGVYSISAVAIGDGQRRSNTSPGNGGGLSWRSTIPVTPGEVLDIVRDNDSSRIMRGSTILLIAYSGGAGNSSLRGKGGKDANPINDGGGNGGVSVNTSYSGAGAGGYHGPGADGVLRVLETSVHGLAAPEGSGAGGSGRIQYNSLSGVYTFYNGGGTSPFGYNGVDGAANGGIGSRPSQGNVIGYGGGKTSVINNGCLRIIWGPDRHFPSTNTHDM